MSNVWLALVFSVLILGFGAGPATATPIPEHDGPSAAVAVQQVPLNDRLPHEALMVIVGTALIALGMAVRRAA